MKQQRWPRKLLAGGLAALAMLAAMIVLRLTSGVLSLPELIGEGIVRTLPGALFSRLLDAVLYAGRPLLLVSIVLGQLILGGLLGLIYAREPGRDRALAIAVLAWLVLGVLILPALGLGVFASAIRDGAVGHALSMLLACLAYGFSLIAFHKLLLQRERAADQPAADPAGRRSVLAKLGLGLAALAVGGYSWRALVEGVVLAPPTSGSPRAGGTSSAASTGADAAVSFSPVPGAPASGRFAVAGLSPEVTPTAGFYTVSKNFFDPHVDVANWSLRIDGLVAQPMTLDYDLIRALPPVSDFYTLQCISNPIGGDLWDNAHWIGVRLKDLLQAAGLQPGIQNVVFHAADDYTDSITLESALDDGAILAYEMNGRPLEKSHGYPARLLIPNIYGMKNVKWITRIELVDYDFQGFWMQRGWDDAAPYKVSSRIDVPSDGRGTQPGTVAIGGVAFAGNRGIRLVEYSLDDGGTWQPAELKSRLARNTWQLWVARPELAPGRYAIKVRATDGDGTLQAGKSSDPFPSGATGYHNVIVTVG